MPYYLIWPILIIICGGNYLIGVLIGILIENRRWQQRRNDTLAAMKATKSYEKKAMPHQMGVSDYKPDYKLQAWETHTLAELDWWVHLLIKCAEHRSYHESAKDLCDAGYYLSMMQAKLEEARLKACKAKQETEDVKGLLDASP